MVNSLAAFPYSFRNEERITSLFSIRALWGLTLLAGPSLSVLLFKRPLTLFLLISNKNFTLDLIIFSLLVGNTYFLTQVFSGQS